MTNVYRIHLKPSAAEGYNHKDIVDFCKEEGIVGVGWSAVTTRSYDNAVLRNELSGYPPKSVALGYQSIRCMRNMEVNDLVWTQFDKTYYLCRVTQKWVDRDEPTEKYLAFDVPNYVRCEWIKVGEQWEVPGGVIRSLMWSTPVQNVNNVEGISKKIWNAKSPKESYKYKIEGKDTDVWNLLGPEEVEEIVMLYLQVVEGYKVHTSAVKRTTPDVEGVLVDTEGNKAYPQVKSGSSICLDAKDYYDKFISKDPKAKVYLFADSQRYSNDNYENVICLKKDDIEDFIRNYKHMFLEKTRLWISMSNFK